MISGYLAQLSAALDFDPALAQRICREVDDHLQQAIVADRSNDRTAAERRAIAAFGEAQALAAQFAMISVAEQMRKVGTALVLVIVSVLVAMKGRIAWYALSGGDAGHEMTPVTRIIGSLDHYAFWLSVIVGIGSFACMMGRRIPVRPDARYRTQLRCILMSCVATIALLAVAVASDGALTAIRLVAAEWRAWSLIPIGTMAVEIACVGILAFQLWTMRLRTAAATSMHIP